jgi:hypothetical protein
MSPADAILAHADLEAAQSLTIHHGTFMLADDGQDQPVDVLSQELKESEVYGRADLVARTRRGERRSRIAADSVRRPP